MYLQLYTMTSSQLGLSSVLRTKRRPQVVHKVFRRRRDVFTAVTSFAHVLALIGCAWKELEAADQNLTPGPRD